MSLERRYFGKEKPLKKVLPELFPDIPYSEIQALLRRRDVKVDGVRVSREPLSVQEGALISIYPKKKKGIKILFEDDNLLACYKPKGIPSEGDISFASFVAMEKGAVRLMHRLDTNTDGVILFTKNDVAYREVYDAMKEGSIRKEYLAEVYGHPPLGGEVNLKYYYKKDAENGLAMISDQEKQGYIPVELSFSVEKETPETSLLRVVIHKGKMHQIRAMLAHYGYFILGDGKYGSDRINRSFGATKTALTACKVSFRFSDDSPLSYLNSIEISIS